MHLGTIERAAAAALLISLAGAAAATASHSGGAAFPGLNGRIVFNDLSGNMLLVNPDGTGVVRVASTAANDFTIGAAFSRDGTRIAYSASIGSDADVFTIRPDGSGQRQVTFSRGTDVDPSVAANGTDSVRLTTEPTHERDRTCSWEEPAPTRSAAKPETTGSRQRTALSTWSRAARAATPRGSTSATGARASSCSGGS